MNDKKESKMILIREKLLVSIPRDFVTFSSLCGAMYFNYRLCGNSKIMSAFFILIMFMSALNRKNNYKMTIHQAKEQIDKWCSDEPDKKDET